MIDRIEARFPKCYRHGNILMIHGDCMDVMAEIGEKEIPIAIVDPEYGISAGKMTHGKGIKNWNKSDWDKKTPDKTYFDKLFQISNKQIIFGGNYFDLPKTNGWLYWSKCKQEGLDQGDGELAWTSFLNVIRETRIIWDGFRGSDGNKIHPTQKPVSLYKWLISRYAKQGELILDTHGGSGSIVIACHDLGHPIIWVEKDAGYYCDAVARYKTHALQAVLFEPVEIMKEQKLFEV